MVMIDSKFDLGQVIIIRQFQLSAAHFWKDSSSNRYCHPFLRPFPSMVSVVLLILAYYPSWKRKDSLRAPSHDHRPDASRPDCFILGVNKVLRIQLLFNFSEIICTITWSEKQWQLIPAPPGLPAKLSDRNTPKVHCFNTPLKINGWNIILEVWTIIFLSKWVICLFHVNHPGRICLFEEGHPFTKLLRKCIRLSALQARHN